MIRLLEAIVIDRAIKGGKSTPVVFGIAFRWRLAKRSHKFFGENGYVAREYPDFAQEKFWGRSVAPT